MTNTQIKAIRDIAEAMRIDVVSLRDRAHAQVAKFPQYTRERFDSYIAVRVLRTIRTKAGVAFIKGEIVLANPSTRRDAFMTAWSFQNKCDTSVPCADLDIAFNIAFNTAERKVAELGA